ncbi:hypothetical protein TNCV_1452421 [Trichonephila clavipes]|nr:hypothetical protein TNCV_1452421 [Trichonephila clavipes]
MQEKDRIHEDLSNIEINGIPGSTFRRRSLILKVRSPGTITSLNPAAKVEEKQFETNIENMIKSIKTLALPVPTRSENFNLFFQSLERAFFVQENK